MTKDTAWTELLKGKVVDIVKKTELKYNDEYEIIFTDGTKAVFTACLIHNNKSWIYLLTLDINNKVTLAD